MAACFFVVFKIKIVQNSSLVKKELAILFALKILAGIAVGIILAIIYKTGTDYDNYNNLGKIETDNLLDNSNIFFTDIYKPYLDKYGSLFFVDAHFISDLGPNIILKILGFLNLITKGNYYCNAIFFNSFAFVGSVALYKVFDDVYKTKKTALIIGCFLLPSTLFFCSGIHKDLVIFTSLCFFCNALYFGLENGFTRKRIFVLILSFVLLTMIRLHVGAVLLPIAAIYFVCKKYNYHFIKATALSFILFICATLIVHQIKPSISSIGILTKKQNEFKQLGNAKTDYNNILLNNSTKNTILAIPSAAKNAFLSPLPFEFPYIPMNLFGLELCIYLGLILLLFLYRNKEANPTNMFVLFGLVFAITMLMMIGLSITNAGSLIRYRSIYLPFIITPILCSINWKLIKQKLIPN